MKYHKMLGINFFVLALGLLSYNNILQTDSIVPVLDNSNSQKTGIYDFDKYYYYPSPKPMPIVILHGITSDTSELAPVAEWLKSRLPNQVYNIEIGNGRGNSLFKTMDWQLKELCLAIYAIPALENGFHFIGMSQGGLLARGYVQRCNRFPVRNLITWVSPHGGVYGFNQVYFNWQKVYTQFYQQRYSFAGYWKDPYQYETYLANSTFLPYLNNESPDMEAYGNRGFNFHQNRERILSLDNFVMIWSGNDDVISPPQSGRFEFYDIVCSTRETQGCQALTMSERNSRVHNMRPCQERITSTSNPLQIQNFFNSSQYVKDLLGLRTLFQNGKLHMLETNCTHSGHKTPACFPQLEKLTFPFLA